MTVIKSIRIKEEEWRELKSMAAKNGNTISKEISRMIERAKQPTKLIDEKIDMFGE